MSFRSGPGAFSVPLICALTLLTLPGCAHAQVRTLTVDDMMRVEGVGTALADPGGRWIVFEKLRPYEDTTDFSFRTYAFEKSGHQLWRLDTVSGDPPELLPGLDPEPHTYAESFSPSGRFLTVLRYSFGSLSLGTYDMEAQHVTFFEPVPAFSRTGDHTPVWISDTRLIYAALPSGAVPLATSVRAHTGQTLTRLWASAWSGEGVTADETRTREPDPTAQQEPGRLILADAATGQVRSLAEGLYADLRLSPDGQYLAALQMSRPHPIAPGRTADSDLRRYRLTVFDLKRQSARTFGEELDVFPYSISWAPDSQRLAVFAWPEGTTPEAGRFHVVDRATGQVQPYDHSGLDLASERERGWLQRPERAVFFGDDLAVFARENSGEGAMAPRFTPRNMRDPGLAEGAWYALGSDGRSRKLTGTIRRVSPVLVHAGVYGLTVWSEEGVFRIQTDGTSTRLTPAGLGPLHLVSRGSFSTRASVARPEFSGTAYFTLPGKDGALSFMLEPERPTEEGASISGPWEGALLAGFPDRDVAMVRREEGPVSVLERVSREGAREVIRINSHLAGLSFGEWMPIDYEVGVPKEGAPTQLMQSCVLLPPGYRAGVPLPLIVDVYPNTAPGCRENAGRITYPDSGSPHLWAGRGYAYVRPAAPRDLIRTAEGPIAGLDIMADAAVRALVEKGIADPDRIILHGFSQGGVSALYVAARSGLYRGVIARHGWADLFSHYFGPSGVFTVRYPQFLGGEFGRYDPEEGGDFNMGATPFEAPHAYYRNSPVFLAPDITAPVLLMHSDMDIFAMSQFDEMFGALRRAGKDARYVRYWGEGHGPSSPANIRDMWARIDAFLEELDVSPALTVKPETAGSTPRPPASSATSSRSYTE